MFSEASGTEGPTVRPQLAATCAPHHTNPPITRECQSWGKHTLSSASAPGESGCTFSWAFPQVLPAGYHPRLCAGGRENTERQGAWPRSLAGGPRSLAGGPQSWDLKPQMRGLSLSQDRGAEEVPPSLRL